MRTAILFLVALAVPSSALAADVLVSAFKAFASHHRVEQVKTASAQESIAYPTKEERRCAYLGRRGSFHILGPNGTAAYRMPSGALHVAELAIGYGDSNWWVYKQVPSDTADLSIGAWAFARSPTCGQWPVLMFRNGTWQRYENTFAWGLGIGDDPKGIGASDAIFDVEKDVRELKKDMRILKKRVDALDGRQEGSAR